MKKGMTRRDFLRNTAVAALGAAAVTPFEASANRPQNRRRVLRIAHFTDVHVQPEKSAPEGMARALRHAQGLSDKPDVIFNGGDSIMDALKADKARAKTQWQIWQSVLKNECALPVVHCIGNHDVWGWKMKEKVIK